MKLPVYFTLYLAVSSLASCDEIGKVACELKVKVVQDDGNPVEGAKVSVRYPVGIKANPSGGFPTDRHETSTDTTNALGETTLKYQTVSSPEGLLWIRKDGYYTSMYEDFKWEKIGGNLHNYRTEMETILKPVKNPIPMLAKRDLRIRTPEFGVAYGFDLEIGESLPPFGNGKVADIEFVLTGKRSDVAGDGKKEHIVFQTEIRCPNPGDGFVEFEIEDSLEFSKGSAFPSAHECPADGYVGRIFREYRNDADGGVKEFYRIRDEIKNKSVYFRVRTRKDENGNILSAHYGKMYGPLEIRPAFKQHGHDVSKGQGGFFIQYLYYNPTPNDRNVEFDPKRNLHPDGNVRNP